MSLKTKRHRRKLAQSDLRTFNGWKAVGRYVRRGERFRVRDKDGRCVFHIDQTDVLGATTPPHGGSYQGWINPDGIDRFEAHDVSKQWIDDHFFADGYMDDVGSR